MGVSQERITSVDWFRGAVIALMVLVNNPGSWTHIFPPLRHAAWHGYTLADFVFPAFLWTAGLSVFLSEERRMRTGKPGKAILPRFLILFGLGLFFHLIPSFDVLHLRIPGVLQRIAICSAVVTLVSRLRSAVWEAAALVAVLGAYVWIMLAGPHSPGDPWALSSNAAGAMDAFLMPGHLWSYSKTWDPEGVVSTLPAIATTLIGSLMGRWVVLPFRRGAVFLSIAGFLLACAALALAPFIPVNKNLWTPSYVLLSAAFCAALFAVVHAFASGNRLLESLGRNALTLYVLSVAAAKALQLFLIGGVPAKAHIVKALFEWSQPEMGSLAFAVAFTAITAGAGYLLDRAGWRLHV
ncbi:MAG: DUF1624 domain-containing protein [Spirochaetia bacterium]|nr:DUF1624 domain-containing protein [Spirochaetia bacterium]